jgi:molybdenum-dependent DNA-binding transcriptional regulator ModE
MNAGKFPTISAAKKEVGGSYYTIRKIIQELEYNSKISPSDSRKGSPLIEAKDGGSELPSGAENIFSEEVVKPTTPLSNYIVLV